MIDTILGLDARGRRQLLAEGHPIDPEALAGAAYRGTSLGMPALFDRLAWKTFQKAFHRVDGRVVGWNVRVEQRGVGAPSVPLRGRDGLPVTFGGFEVLPAAGRGVPAGCDRGLLLDYGRGGNHPLDPTSWLRDPLVAVRREDSTLLFGWSYVSLFGLAVGTPSFFVLEREHEVRHVPRFGRPTDHAVQAEIHRTGTT